MTEENTMQHDGRRRFLAGALLASAVALAPLAHAQGNAAAYPTKPIKLVVGFPPGGPVDTLARVLAKQLSESLGQAVVVDNRAGANGVIGTDVVVKSAPDGYTLLMGASTMPIQATMTRNLPYDTLRDLAPISGVASAPLLLVTNPSLPAKNVRELVDYMRAQAGAVSYASPSSGSANHLAAEMLKTMTGVQAVHVPYKGGAPAEVDVMGGRVAFMFDAIPSALPHVRAGRMRALAVSSEKRSSAAPEIPTIAESGFPGFDVTTWYGVFGPAGMSPDVVSRLSTEIGKALETSEMKERLATLGSEPMQGTPAQFGDFIRREIVKWAKVIKESGATAD
jgi:tripartite-type tricarboxylate transporter receptor subunit TctC